MGLSKTNEAALARAYDPAHYAEDPGEVAAREQAVRDGVVRDEMARAGREEADHGLDALAGAQAERAVIVAREAERFGRQARTMGAGGGPDGSGAGAPGVLSGVDDRMAGVADGVGRAVREEFDATVDALSGLPGDVGDYFGLTWERTILGAKDAFGATTPAEAERMRAIDGAVADHVGGMVEDVAGLPGAVADWAGETRDAWRENEAVTDRHAAAESTDEATRGAAGDAAYTASAGLLGIVGGWRKALGFLRGPDRGGGGGAVEGLLRERPRVEDGNPREGWQHIQERHMNPDSTGDQFASGTTRAQVEEAVREVVEKGVRTSLPNERIQVYEHRLNVNGLRANYRVVVDSQDANRVVTAFPVGGGH